MKFWNRKPGRSSYRGHAITTIFSSSLVSATDFILIYSERRVCVSLIWFFIIILFLWNKNYFLFTIFLISKEIWRRQLKYSLAYACFDIQANTYICVSHIHISIIGKQATAIPLFVDPLHNKICKTYSDWTKMIHWHQMIHGNGFIGIVLNLMKYANII